MADSVQKVIEIVFAGDDQVSGTVRDIGSAFSTIESGVSDVLNPLANLADGVLAADAALAAMAVGGLALALKASVEFESSMIELQKVVGDQPDELKAAKEAAFALSTQYGESASEVLLSTADFKQAGFDIESAMLLTANALDLVIAGGVGADEASSILVATLKGFKAPAEDAARLIDVLNEVSNNYATDVQQLAIAMAALSPVASTMGFSFEETAGVLTPVIEVFRNGGEAANALKVGLLRLVDDQKPVQEALAALGVAQKDANGELRSGKDILADVATAFTTLEENQKLAFASQLVGINQAARMVEVFNGLSKSTEVTATAMNAAGSAAAEVEARLGSAEVAVNRFKVGFENLGIIVGDEFLEAAKGAISGATEIEEALQALVADDTFDPLFTLLREWATEFGEFLTAIAEALPDAFKLVSFDPLLEAIGVLQGEFEDFFDGIDLDTPEGLAEVIQFVVNAISDLIVVTAGMVEQFRPWVDGLISTIEGFNALDDASKKTTGNILALAKGVVDGGLLIVGALTVIGEHAELVTGVIDTVFGAVKIGINILQVAFDQLAYEILDIVATINEGFALITFGGLSDQFEESAKSIRTTMDAIGENLVRNMGEMGDGWDQMTRGLGFANDEAENLSQTVKDLPAQKVVDVTVEADKTAEEYEALFDEIFGPTGDKVKVPIDVEVSETAVENSFQELNDQIAAAKEKSKIEIEPEVKEISKEDLERIKTQAEIIQTSLEFSAKVEIADIEANADIMVAAFDAVQESVSSTADATATMFQAFTEFEGTYSEKFFLRDLLEAQQEIQQNLSNSQVELNNAQADYIRAKTEALEEGEGLITISADGLEPELEAFMWKIVEKIQIRANEASAEFLLGIA